MPQARAGGRARAPDRLDRAPHRLTRALDSRARLVRCEPRPAAFSRSRPIGSAQRIELGNRKAGAKIFAGLTHPRGDRAAALHRAEGVNGAIRPGGPALLVGDRALHPLDDAAAAAFRRGPTLDVAVDRMVNSS